MSYPRYPEYKDSGVEWLGKVPTHWEVCLLKRNFRSVDYGISDALETEGMVAILRMGNIENGKVVTDDLKYTDAVDETLLLARGDLLYNRTNSLELVGKVGLFIESGGRPVSFASYLVRLRVVDDCLSEYFAYLLNGDGILGLARANAFVAIGQCNLSPSRYGQIPVVVPPRSEQAAIVKHLDSETAKIDALVTEQQRLIDLLKEKRQAVISHAVTKGLNPDSPMKPSGVEWLGEVPAHWDVSKMKWIAKMESGHTPDKKVQEYWENGTIPWVSLNDTGYLKEHDYISDTAYQITELGIANSSAHLLPARAVVFSRDATIGRCAITTRPMAVSQHFIAWVCEDSMAPEFLLLVLRSMTQELDSLTTGATLKTIGMPEVRTLVTPVPPPEEQEEITRWCANEARALDALTTEAEAAIDLLQERRTALISAAVTGQIDVRALADRAAA